MSSVRTAAVALAGLAALSCASHPVAECAAPRDCPSSADASLPRDARASVDAGSRSDAAGPGLDAGEGARIDAGAPDAGPPPLVAVERVSRDLVCELISGDEIEYESANRTHTRFNLRGTDLGIPAVVGDDLHFFFGDTHGYREIWRVGEDPDSVARAPLAEVRADLRALCDRLEFYVTDEVPSTAADTDGRILRDFEGAYLIAPPGERIRDYIDRPVPAFETETGSFAGSFEVPAGVLGRRDGAYVFWATRPGTEAIGPMRMSFVARWSGGPRLTQQILHRLDDLSWDRPLGGHFLQVAPVERDGLLYLFGTGEYRRDGVHVARKPIERLEEPGGFELYDPRSGAWVEASALDADARAAIPATLDEGVRGIGELGVQYVEDAGLYVMMFQQASDTSGGNHMALAVARRPEGPWLETSIIAMHDPAFAARHCCLGDTCPGEQILHCDRAGLYGIYPLPLIETERTDGGIVLDVPFVASTWQPYNVVLFRTRVLVRGG
ncbi:MAG: hypothetical protein SangKO_091330 [Sandaracinaceae bacterium]